MTFSTIGSIANFLQTSLSVPTGLSGANLLAVVDSNRQHVSNFVGVTIGSTSIQPQYEPPIVNYSKADAMDFILAQNDGEKISLGELSMEETGQGQSSSFWRNLADSQLKSAGRGVQFKRSLS